MNILLFDDHDLSNDREITLRDYRAKHIREILKLSAGQQLRIGRIDGKSGVAAVTEVSTDEVRIEFSDLDDEPPAPSPIQLILALPRPKSLKRTMRAIANLGIKSVHLIHSGRVEKPYWTAPVLEPTMMRTTLLEGLSIARDTMMPTIRLHRLFKPFVQDVAPHLIDGAAYVAHPGNDAAAIKLTGLTSKVQLAIGPEGGFTDYEIGLFREAGFETLSLGSRIYSVECAIPVLEATLCARFNSRV